MVSKLCRAICLAGLYQFQSMKKEIYAGALMHQGRIFQRMNSGLQQCVNKAGIETLFLPAA